MVYNLTLKVSRSWTVVTHLLCAQHLD